MDAGGVAGGEAWRVGMTLRTLRFSILILKAVVATVMPKLYEVCMWPFAKAVLGGTFVGAAPFLLFTLMLGFGSLPEGFNGDGRLLPSLWIAVAPIAVTLPIVLASSVVFGLPVTAILQRNGRECDIAYIGAGAVIGILVPIALLQMMAAREGYWLSLLGALSGGMTGYIWWKDAREPIVTQQREALSYNSVHPNT